MFNNIVINHKGIKINIGQTFNGKDAFEQTATILNGCYAGTSFAFDDSIIGMQGLLNAIEVTLEKSTTKGGGV